MKTRTKVAPEIFNNVPAFIRRDTLINIIARQLADGHYEVYKLMAAETLSDVTRSEYKEWKSISIQIDDDSPWKAMSEVERLAVILATEYMMMNINLEVYL